MPEQRVRMISTQIHDPHPCEEAGGWPEFEITVGYYVEGTDDLERVRQLAVEEAEVLATELADRTLANRFQPSSNARGGLSMNRKTLPYIVLFLGTIVAANLIVTHYGPWITPYVAFSLIGLDFVTRDRLADFWGTKRWSKMLLLIATGSVISYAVNKDAATIALASTVAFAAAELVEAIVYHLMRDRPWSERAPRAALFAAAVDSLLFPWIAFGSILWGVTLGQFFAKVAGAVVWAWVFGRFARPPAVAPEAV